jgi:hypothetical protein
MKQNLRISTSELSYTDLALGLRLQDFDLIQTQVTNIEKEIANALIPAGVTGVWVGTAPNISVTTTGTTSTWNLNGGSGVVWIKNKGIFQYVNHTYTGSNTTDYPKLYLQKIPSETRTDKRTRSHNLYGTNNVIIKNPSVAVPAGYTDLGEITGVTTTAGLAQWMGTNMNRREPEKTSADKTYFYTPVNSWTDLDFKTMIDMPIYGTPSYVICSVYFIADDTKPCRVAFKSKDHTVNTRQLSNLYRPISARYNEQILIPVDSNLVAQYYIYDTADYNVPAFGDLTIMGVL